MSCLPSILTDLSRQVDDESTVIVLADWFHSPSPTLLAAYTASTNTASVDQLPQSGTINGGKPSLCNDIQLG
jgi:Multicopper oxidase